MEESDYARKGRLSGKSYGVDRTFQGHPLQIYVSEAEANTIEEAYTKWSKLVLKAWSQLDA